MCVDKIYLIETVNNIHRLISQRWICVARLNLPDSNTFIFISELHQVSAYRQPLDVNFVINFAA
jgi:hypothetical protein